MIESTLQVAQPASAVAPPARGGTQGQGNRSNHYGMRGGYRTGRTRRRLDAQFRGGHDHFYASPARAEVEASNVVIIGMIVISQPT